MEVFDDLIIIVAYLLKYLHTPHIVKYIFYLFIRKRKLVVQSNIDVSGVRVSLNIENFIDYWVFMDGLYEKDWVERVRPLVKNKILVEVGANIGVYTLSLFKDASFVYAFEPEEENYRRLVNNVKKNRIKNIKVIKKAVADKSKNVTLFLSQDSGSHSLRLSSKIKSKIKAVTIDSYFANKKLDIGLIIIDVEGSEFDVLKGARKILKKGPALLVEFNRSMSELCNQDLSEMYSWITERSYLAYGLRNNSLIRVNRPSVGKIYNENLLFLKR